MAQRYVESIRCPYCAQLNEPDATNCRWCGKALKPSFGDKPPLVGEGSAKGVLPWICQVCGREIGLGLMPPARCGVCGKIVCDRCLSRTWRPLRRGPAKCLKCERNGSQR